MSRIIIFAILIFFAPIAHSGIVKYACNTEKDYLLITHEEEDSDQVANAANNEETIATYSINIIGGSDSNPMRTGTKPVAKQCQLSSGSYIVTFNSYWLNNNLLGPDGGDDWITIEIKKKKAVVLPETVIGRCDINRPATEGCKNKWAVEVRLNGKVGIPELIHLRE